jgi:serine/threonine protein phosphatase PrpC
MIRAEHAHLGVAAYTHPGMTGKQNEDRFAVSAYRVAAGNPTPSVFAVIADGIGGHRGGELAAEMAVNSISHSVAQSDAFEPVNTLRRAVQAASQAIIAQAINEPQHLGMGTTCACAWVIGRRLYTASVGDSRIYMLRDTTIRQLTTDHTWIQEAIDKGILSAEQLRERPNIHVIRRYLGSAIPPEADLRMRVRGDETDTQAEANQGLLLHPGDRLLLCTDGLTDEVNNEEIRAAVAGLDVSIHPGRSLLTKIRKAFGVSAQASDLPDGSGQQLKSAAQALVELANSRGGFDNVTIVLMQVPGKPPKPRQRL